MQSRNFTVEAARKQLEKVLVAPGFARNERLSRFLRFVVERHLEGQDGELKETLIAIQVFGRKPDYDPKIDSIVRTEATRLRSRLAEYYAGEGSGEPLVIELPKGGYIPAISERGGVPETPARPGWHRFRLRVWITAGVAVVLVATATAALVLSSERAPVNIAVLPLENLGHDPANDYFVDGLTAEIIRNLSVIDGLAVRSQTSSFAFRGKPRDVREAGKQLAADYVVEGSVLRVGQQLRIDAQFVRVRDDSPVWSGKFDRELTDVFAIQDEISRGIVNSLRLKLGRGRRRYETSTEAYDLYLPARALDAQSFSIFASLPKRVELYSKVVEKDPSFAPAYAGLATAYASRWDNLNTESADADWLRQTQAAADKAIELDPLLADAYRARGFVHIAQKQWAAAENDFRRAIELGPGSSETCDDFAINLLMTVGRIEEAVKQARAAVRTDPLSPRAHSALTFVLISAGRYEEAAEHDLKMSDSDPIKILFLARARLGQGRINEAIRLLETEEARKNPNQGFLGYAYARGGRRAEANKVAAENGRPQTQVLTYAGLGDKDRTFEALVRMAARSVWRVGEYLTYPELSFLRGDPRLKDFRKKIGLPQ